LLECSGSMEGDGAARSPNTPINGARDLGAAVPGASPAQTRVDQVTLPARSEIIDSGPGRLPKPAAKSKSRASITKPRRIASHATRRSVAPRLPAGVLSVAPVVCCDLLTVTAEVSFLDDALSTVSPEKSAGSACTSIERISGTQTPRKAPGVGGVESLAISSCSAPLARSTRDRCRAAQDKMMRSRVASSLLRPSALLRA
jgi:hypothetical protein